jgi:hypothetical protein
MDTMWRRATTMNDLVAMALECDATRIVTYMLDNSRSDLNYSWLLNPDGSRVAAWHAETHVESPGYASNPPGFRAITSFMCRIVADLVTKLDAVPDGERSLLDNSVVLFGSDVHNADHAMVDLPMIIFGSLQAKRADPVHRDHSRHASAARSLFHPAESVLRAGRR